MQLSITNMILHAGPISQFVMLVLLIFSLISWSIVFMKMRLFRKVTADTQDFLDAFWSSNKLSEAYDTAQEYEYSPEAAIFSAGFTELQKINKIRTRKENTREGGREGMTTTNATETLDMQMATMDNLKRAIRKAESQEMTEMGKYLPFLATTGSATPFIGLFGTVWGIMASFHEIGAKGSASLAVVAPGISEALVATAAGLAVAIPAVIFYNYYANKLSYIDGEMQNFSTDFLNLVERDLIGRG